MKKAKNFPFKICFQFPISTFCFYLCLSVLVLGGVEGFISVFSQPAFAQEKVAVKAAPAKEKADLIIAGGTVVTMDGQRRVIENGGVAVRGDSIVMVGTRAAVEAKYAAPRTILARGRLVLPGLINTHGHAPMVLFRGIGDDLVLQEWLEKYIFPAEALNVTEEFVLAGTRLAALEMLRSGTTTFADMYYFEDAIARVAKEAGMRGVLGETILDFPAPDNKTHEQMLAYTEKFLQRWKGDPLIRAAVAPHAIYTCSEQTLKDSFALARKYNAPVLIHLSETKREVDESKARHGVSPPAYLDRLGLLGPDVLAAHCVWLDQDDITLVVKRDAGCAHNPASNMMLSSGAAPLSAMIAAGMRLGLGTDSAAANNDLNMFEEIDLAAKLHKLSRMNPSALTAQQAVEMATIGGARSIHMEREIGSIEAGKKADLILLRVDAPHAVPFYNVYSLIAYSLKGSDVESVLINGRVVMQNRRVLTLNEPEVIARAREQAEKVKKSLAKK